MKQTEAFDPAAVERQFSNQETSRPEGDVAGTIAQMIGPSAPTKRHVPSESDSEITLCDEMPSSASKETVEFDPKQHGKIPTSKDSEFDLGQAPAKEEKPLDSSQYCTPAEKLLKADPFYRITRAKRFQQENRRDPSAGFVYGIHKVLRSHVKGGMGMVHIAYDQFLKREVALKELFKDSTADESIVHRFIVEAEITAQLEHPGIVPIHSLGLDLNGNPYYTMKFIRGRTLQEATKLYFKEPSEQELKRLMRRFVSVCQTMSFVHKKGVVHRDLKPANIMLGEHGETLVMDWGIAKTFPVSDETGITVSDTASASSISGSSSYSRPELTMAGTVVGTPAFMSPEQASPESNEVGPISDIFSLGAILFYMLTGRNAYTGKNSQEILTKVLTSAPPKPSDVARNIPPGLEAICLKAMARNPKNRYQCADDLVTDLCSWLDGEPITALQETFYEKTWRLFRKNRQISLSLFLVLMFFFMIFSGLSIFLVQGQMRKHYVDAGARPVSERIDGLLEQKRELETQFKQARNDSVKLLQNSSEAPTEAERVKFEAQAKKADERAENIAAEIRQLERLHEELGKLRNEIQQDRRK